MSIVVPAVLPTSKKDLEEKLALFASFSGISRVQIDVVDGKFASPASWPYNALVDIQTKVQNGEILPYLDRFEYEIDLMCFDVEQAIHDWLQLGATRLTLHVETTTDMSRLLASIQRKYGAGDGLLSVGLSLSNTTDLALIEPYLERVQYVQCMGIATIGKQGQLFDRRVLEKVSALRKKYPALAVQVDGGISLANAHLFSKLGVSNLIIGSSLIHSPDPQSVIDAIGKLKSPFSA
jgi:ribulose-phosphate 3-epimerase